MANYSVASQDRTESESHLLLLKGVCQLYTCPWNHVDNETQQNMWRGTAKLGHFHFGRKLLFHLFEEIQMLSKTQR